MDRQTLIEEIKYKAGVLTEAETELAATGDQTFVNNRAVDSKNLPENMVLVNRIKKIITNAGLWDKFKSRNVVDIDIDPSKVHRNKVWVMSDSGTLYVYDVALNKLQKALPEEQAAREKELLLKKKSNLEKSGKLKKASQINV